MKPKTKKPRTRKPRTKRTTGKISKDKSVKQEVRVNVQSSGGGGSGGSSIPTPQPIQNPILSSFKQAEKTGENIDIKRMNDLINKLGVGISNLTAETNNKAILRPIFEGDEIPSEVQVLRKADNSGNTLFENLNEANRPREINILEKLNYDDELEEAQITNNPNINIIEDVPKNKRGGKRAGAGRPKKIPMNVDLSKPIVEGMLTDMVEYVDNTFDLKETEEEKRKREEITPELIEEYKKKLFS